MIIIYAMTIFLGAFLLFQVQLIIGKYILPWYGGTPAVWSTCMLFFQVVVLGGYACAHGLVRIPLRRQVVAQLLFLLSALLVIGHHVLSWSSPLFPNSNWQPPDNTQPSGRILLLLSASVGLAGLVLSTTSPLLQSWFSKRWTGRSPYRLYALSNLGSLLGLISYPFLLEPILSLKAQASFWACGYGVFTAGFIACLIDLKKQMRSGQAPLSPPPLPGNAPSIEMAVPVGFRQRFFWFLLPACGSMLLLATTNRMCQDIAVVPFLWVCPLTIYLLTFIICFDNPKWYSRIGYMFAFTLASIAACIVLFRGGSIGLVVQISAYAFIMFAGCMVCHGELAKLKPPTSQLTSYYLTMAAGGAAGGLSVGIIAPLIFSGFWEFHLALWLGWVLLIGMVISDKDSLFYRGDRRVPIAFIPAILIFIGFMAAPALPKIIFRGWDPQYSTIWYYLMILTFSGIVVARLAQCPEISRVNLNQPIWVRTALLTFFGLFELALLSQRYDYFDTTLVTTRNFYGVLRIEERDRNKPSLFLHVLRHGEIIHGIQYQSNEARHKPMAYYGEESGLGRALLFHPGRNEKSESNGHLRIGAVGLGVGTIAAYGRPGDLLTFYEINPGVIRLAKNRQYFSYLNESSAKVEIVPGDARLSLARELREGQFRQFDVLVLDAFSSDAIPAHLLTREAFEIYMKQLSVPDGILAVHISNRYLDLRPVMAQIAAHFKLEAWDLSSKSRGTDIFTAQWILMSRKESRALSEIADTAKAKRLTTKPIRLWTDDFSNILGTLR